MEEMEIVFCPFADDGRLIPKPELSSKSETETQAEEINKSES